MLTKEKTQTNPKQHQWGEKNKQIWLLYSSGFVIYSNEEESRISKLVREGEKRKIMNN